MEGSKTVLHDEDCDPTVMESAIEKTVPCKSLCSSRLKISPGGDMAAPRKIGRAGQIGDEHLGWEEPPKVASQVWFPQRKRLQQIISQPERQGDMLVSTPGLMDANVMCADAIS